MADTLPTVDFNFEELRQRMAQFTQRFDEFIERGRKRVLEEKNAFRMNVADLEGMYILFSMRPERMLTTRRPTATEETCNCRTGKQIVEPCAHISKRGARNGRDA